MINENSSSTRSGSSSTYSIYYYDIINDKELSVNDICNKFNISLNEIKIIDESAENIYAVMPLYGNTYDVYYKQNATCPSYHCQDVVTITTR